MKKLPSLLAVSTLLAGSAMASGDDDVTTIVFNSFISSQHFFNQEILHPWLEEVTEATEGRVVFEVPSSSLAAPHQQYDSIVNGVFDAGYLLNSINPERVKLMSMAQLPFITTTPEQNSVALWRTYQEYFADTEEFSDLKVLGTFVTNPAELFSLGEPIKGVEDIRGRRSYAVPGVSAYMMQGLGSGVLAQPAVRSYEIISSGAVDLFTGYSTADAIPFRTLQFIESITDIPGYISAPSFTLVFNQEVWNSLDERDQRIIESLAGEEWAQRFAIYSEKQREAREQASASGIEFYEASDALMEALNEVGYGLHQEWIDTANAMGVDGRAALDFYIEQSNVNHEIER
ncbi:hypothetical protein LY622_14720 [Halomonas sp. M5N1S17]|uniref:hypothetical protein n=1 Tax=Halomonas alkalisoli TaxID=2907158 RepID=UPI001F419B8E|nr:hypothetical protein [Halomonas alkalisoli]MCE9664692.1 hypothetical protein [Halomonas alkalisoli]